MARQGKNQRSSTMRACAVCFVRNLVEQLGEILCRRDSFWHSFADDSETNSSRRLHQYKCCLPNAAINVFDVHFVLHSAGSS